jgi:hypothetical protein
MTMAINVTVLKYYQVYSSEYVNNFLKMLRKRTTVPFKFWVQTEDPSGLDAEIGILPIEVVDPVGRRWHKLDLFETPLLEGKCFHFDLDMVINKNIDHYLNYEPKKLAVLYASYKDVEKIRRHNQRNPNDLDTMVNSSIFCWNVGCESTKEILRIHYAKKVDNHKGSFDRFIGNDCVQSLELFPYRDYTLFKNDGFSREPTFCLFNQRIGDIAPFLDPL